MSLKNEPRLVAIVHRATIGSKSIDALYFKRREEARSRGYLWGSYHWGLPGNPEQQADFYIDMAKPANDELVALDLEDVTSGKFMNIDEAERFISRIKQRVGRYPLVYANHKVARILSQRSGGSVFAKTPLWYARFRKDIPDCQGGLWTTYTLWQFSSEILPQYAIPGTKKDMDVNVYNGTVEQLRSNWPLTRQ